MGLQSQFPILPAKMIGAVSWKPSPMRFIIVSYEKQGIATKNPSAINPSLWLR
jgi:hypothetical protein